MFATTGSVSAADLSAMADEVRHRGPDGEGYVLFEGATLRARCAAGADTPPGAGRGLGYSPSGLIAAPGGRESVVAALGHRRLAIIDLSPAGHQPMCTADGRYWITYNGEVYNYVELRAELEQAGHRFDTNTDTEVLLASYRHWGEACLARLNGMFAFVIFDRVARTVFAARDRFGVKPLYYWASPAGFLAFASEIMQFAVLRGWKAVLNGQRAYDFLNWGLFDHTTDTLFAGVRQLRGGEYVACPIAALVEGLPVRRWYGLAASASAGDAAAGAARFRALLEDSVRLRLRADVPIGSCLSGGLDSSSIVCVANEQLRALGAERVQKTFSARSSDPRFDEGRFIDAVVRHTGVENRQVDPSPAGLFELLPRIVWHQDEPFGSTSIYAQWQVFGLAAKSGVPVMLDGQGADEQLAGYTSFFPTRFSHLLRRGNFVALLAELRATRQRHGTPARLLAAHTANAMLPESVRQPLRRLARRPAAAAVDWLDLERLSARPGDPFLACAGKARSVYDLSVAQLLHTSLPMLLHWEDRDSMAHSIEARVPFLDYRLVELTLGLPEDQKIAKGVTKRVLRDAMRGLLPEEVRTRMDKVGFATAEEQWMRERPDDFRAALRAAVEASRGVLRPSALSLLEDVIAGRQTFSHLPWRMISFGAWMGRFGVALP